MTHANTITIDPVNPFADLESDDLEAAPGETPAGGYLEHLARHARTATGFKADAERARVNPLTDCPKCHGTGRYAFVSSLGHSHCTKCGGTGKVRGLLMDPKSVARRAKAVERKVAEERVELSRRETWRAEHADVVAWLEARRGSFNFATSLSESLENFGRLTPNQVTAVRTMIAEDAARKAARLAAAPSIAGAGFSKLLEAFAKAIASGLKSPKIRIGELTFSPAKAASTNAGCLYVKRGEAFSATYLGKITGEGRLLAVRECTDADRAEITRIGTDPLAEAIAHGKKTGRCACCGRELTDPESVARGIGPICAENFGW